MAPPTAFSFFRGQHKRNGSSPTTAQTPQWQNLAPSQYPDAGSTLLGPARPVDDDDLLGPSPISPLPPTLPPIPRIASHRKPISESNRPEQPVPSYHSRVESDTSRDRQQPASPGIPTDTPVPSMAGSSAQIPPPLPPVPRVSSRHGVDQNEGYATQPRIGQYRRNQGQVQPHLQEQAQLNRARADETLKPYANKSSLPRLITEDTGVGSEYGRTTERMNGLRRPNDLSIKPQDSTQRPSTPSNKGEHLTPFNKSANSSPSPSSSLSSFQKPTAVVTSEPSPGSSQTTQSSNAAPKTSKARMLLNPMSLLMRRRTSHSSDALTDDLVNNNRNPSVPAMNLPDDYDPRIKGKRVHDFSEPWQRQNFSYEERNSTSQADTNYDFVDGGSRRQSLPSLPLEPTQEESGSSSLQRTPEIERTPVFIENFNETADDDTSSSAVHRESLANPSFLARWSKTLDTDIQDHALPNRVPATDDSTAPVNRAERSSKTTDATSWRTNSDRSTARSSVSNETRSTSPPQSPPKSRSSATLEPSPQFSSSLKHMPSGASRFSFQMNNESSVAQEKALEEKHKQKAATEAFANAATGDRLDELSDEEGYDDYDDMDDGLEEAIPGVNVDADEEDITVIPFNEPPEPSNIPDMTASDEQGDSEKLRPATLGTQALMSGLGLVNLEHSSSQAYDRDTKGLAPIQNDEQAIDDGYYDDGTFEEPDEQDEHEFDESVFDLPEKSHYDDPRPFSKFPPQPAQLRVDTSQGNDVTQGDATLQPDDDEEYLNVAKFGGPAVSHQVSQRQPQAGLALSQDRLMAYQNALANAANEAAAQGRFDRKSSVTTYDSGYGGVANGNLEGSDQVKSQFDDWNAYEDDSGAEDDPMVAAANAEALASDDEGFYGREFGFYSNGGAEAQFFNGGYLGDAGADGLGRSLSGHNACKEPNLTPITERSEFSNRNSFISLSTWNSAIPGSLPRDGAYPSPGLAQIAAGLGDEEDMTLSQLIELRRKAFGGGGGSTVSLTGSTTSSPSSSTAAPFSMRNDGARAAAYAQLNAASDATPRPLRTEANPAGTGPDASPHSSIASLSSASGLRPLPSSFTPTSPQVPQLQSPVAQPSPPGSTPMPSNSLLNKFNNRRSWHQHRHSTSSGGISSSSDRDSVAYVQEEDTTDPGVMRWVLERRRTEDTGEVRVVGRTVVEGGRI